jgi:hypothetical protein
VPSLLFTCPATRNKASTGIETDAESLRKCWQTTLKVRCPHCGKDHKISVRKTYIDMALDEAIDRTAAFVSAPEHLGKQNLGSATA